MAWRLQQGSQREGLQTRGETGAVAMGGQWKVGQALLFSSDLGLDAM